MTTKLDTKDPRETVVLTLDATPELASGETLTGSPEVAVTMERGSDPDAESIITGATINNAPITGTSIQTGQCVQAIASGGLSGCWYLIAITCTTSNPEKVLTLKAILPVSDQ